MLNQVQRYLKNRMCIQIVEDTCIVWKPDLKDLQFLSPVEIHLAALKRIVRHSESKLQLWFNVDMPLYAATDINQCWNALDVTIEFFKSSECDSFETKILEVIEKRGFPKPIISDFQKIKMSTSKVVIALEDGFSKVQPKVPHEPYSSPSSIDSPTKPKMSVVRKPIHLSDSKPIARSQVPSFSTRNDTRIPVKNFDSMDDAFWDFPDTESNILKVRSPSSIKVMPKSDHSSSTAKELSMDVAARKAAEKREAERRAAEKKEAKQKAAEKKAAEKAEKLAAEKKAAEKKAVEKQAAEKRAAEKKAAEKMAAEKRAAERKAEKQAAEMLRAEKKAAEKLEAEEEAAKITEIEAENLKAKQALKEATEKEALEKAETAKAKVQKGKKIEVQKETPKSHKRKNNEGLVSQVQASGVISPSHTLESREARALKRQNRGHDFETPEKALQEISFSKFSCKDLEDFLSIPLDQDAGSFAGHSSDVEMDTSLHEKPSEVEVPASMPMDSCTQDVRLYAPKLSVEDFNTIESSPAPAQDKWLETVPELNVLDKPNDVEINLSPPMGQLKCTTEPPEAHEAIEPLKVTESTETALPKPAETDETTVDVRPGAADDSVTLLDVSRPICVIKTREQYPWEVANDEKPRHLETKERLPWELSKSQVDLAEKEQVLDGLSSMRDQTHLILKSVTKSLVKRLELIETEMVDYEDKFMKWFELAAGDAELKCRQAETAVGLLVEPTPRVGIAQRELVQWMRNN